MQPPTSSPSSRKRHTCSSILPLRGGVFVAAALLLPVVVASAGTGDGLLSGNVVKSTDRPTVLVSSNDFDLAISSFQESNFEMALQQTERYLRNHPRDPSAIQLHALCLFAKGEYQSAGKLVRSVLERDLQAVWTWQTLSQLYPDPSIYTKQLRALETFAKSHPDDAPVRFLQAYHYLVDGFPDTASRVLAFIVRTAGDQVAVSVLKSLPNQTMMINQQQPNLATIPSYIESPLVLRSCQCGSRP